MHLTAVTILKENFPANNVYPFNLEIFHKSRHLDFQAPVTFFVGENGTGKSTLLYAIAKRCKINIWKDIDGRRFQNNPYEERFYQYVEAKWSNDPVPGSYFSSDIFRDFSRFLDDWAASDPGILECYGGKSLITQSHGQSLMTYFNTRYKIRGLYFLDEPETALSPARQFELLKVIQSESKAGHAQFIIATHSPILISCPGALIYNFNSMPIQKVNYKNTDLFRMYRSFFQSME